MMFRTFLSLLVVLLCSLPTTTTAFAPIVAIPSKTITTTSTTHYAESGGPAVLDKPTTVEKTDVDKDTEKDSKFSSQGWEIRLFNDPFNKREFVARCLATICGKSDTESYQIMMEAHNNGMGVIGRYLFEVAELYYKSLQDNGLLVDMVPVEDE